MTRQSEHQKPSRQSKHYAKRKAEGYAPLHVRLSPDEQQRFAVLVERCGDKTKAFRWMLGELA